jgi:carbon storage regulator
MLILSRKVEQSIIINGDIVVKVLRLDRDKVKLGIDAPEKVIVNREEIQLAHDGTQRRGIPAIDCKAVPIEDLRSA